MQLFGGDWTEEKLKTLAEYLKAWANVMKNQPFERIYVDAFAGTGYREASMDQCEGGFFASELAEEEPQRFLDGSVRIALSVKPFFDKYVFIERSAKRFAELQRVRDEFPSLGERMFFYQSDSNVVIQEICRRWDSRNTRGVLFLDPFGMQVDWDTLQSVAATRSIDVWILFPLGIGVNRLLPSHGNIPEGWRQCLTRVFGTGDWYKRFYKPTRVGALFDMPPEQRKTASYNAIADYYQERLRSVFAEVAKNPKVITNSRGMPLYLLCFAVGNPAPKATAAALGISEHILGKE